MLSTTDDLRIRELKELSTPEEVMREVPRTLTATRVAMGARNAIHAILGGTDDRLLVIVGPCSIHDPDAAIDYATVSPPCASASPTGSRSSCGSISRSRGPPSAGRG